MWQDGQDVLSDQLVKMSKSFWVNVHPSPMMLIREAGSPAVKAMIRELEDWDDVNDTRPFVLSCTSPAGAEALHRLAPVVSALIARKSRLKFAAIGEDTAVELMQALLGLGIAKVRFEDILRPSVSGHVDKLANALIEKCKPGTMIGILESSGDRGEFAQRCVAGGLRVVRMPVFSAAIQELSVIPRTGLPLWILVTASATLKAIVQDLQRSKVNLNEVRWIGSVASVGVSLSKILPDARYSMVPDLRADLILDKIAKS
jgi:uroporphyrinogen-III synthase